MSKTVYICLIISNVSKFVETLEAQIDENRKNHIISERMPF